MAQFVFNVNQFVPVPGQPARFQCVQVRGAGATVEQAAAQVANQIPPGHRIFMWFEVPASAH